MSKRRSRKARRRLIRRIIICLVAAAAVAGFLAAFRLKYVYVSGNMHNSPDEITEVLTGRPILGNTVITKILNDGRKLGDADFPERLYVDIISRDTVRVRVVERRFVGRVLDDGRWYYIDNGGTVNAVRDEPLADDNIPPVEGLAVSGDIVLGKRLPIISSKPVSMLEMLLARCEVNLDMCPDKVVFNNIGEMTIIYGGVKVLLGNGEKLEVRLKELSAVISQLYDGRVGTLHMENYDGSSGGIVFTPSD